MRSKYFIGEVPLNHFLSFTCHLGKTDRTFRPDLPPHVFLFQKIHRLWLEKRNQKYHKFELETCRQFNGESRGGGGFPNRFENLVEVWKSVLENLSLVITFTVGWFVVNAIHLDSCQRTIFHYDLWLNENTEYTNFWHSFEAKWLFTVIVFAPLRGWFLQKDKECSFQTLLNYINERYPH